MPKVDIDTDTLDRLTVEGLKSIYLLTVEFECTQESLAALVLLEYMTTEAEYQEFLDELD